MEAASAQNDMKAVSDYSQQIHRLRMGEDSGVLSPTAASIRMQAITKEWATRYPHLTADFKKLYAGAGAGGGGAGSDIKLEQDPQLAARLQLLKEAELEGVSVAEILRRKRNAQSAIDEKQLTDMKASLGLNAQPEAERFVNAIAATAADAAWTELYGAAREGKVDKDFWAASVSRGRDRFASQLREYFYQLEKQSGVQFDSTWKKSVVDMAVAPLNDIIEKAQGMDSNDKLKRLAEVEMSQRQNRSEQVLEKMFGSKLYPIANLTKDPYAFFESVQKVLDAQRTKTGKALQDQIATMDAKTRALVRFVGTDAFRQTSEENLKGVMEQGATGAIPADPVLTKAMTSQAAQVIKSPHIAPEQKENLGEYLVKEDPNVVNTNEDVRTLLQTSEGFRARTDRILTQSIEAAGNDMDPPDFDALSFGDKEAEAGPMGAQSPTAELSPSAEADQTGGMYSYPAVARQSVAEAQKLADRLNQYYMAQIAGGATVEEAHTKTGKLLGGVIASRTQSAQRPTRAQQQEAAGKPVLSKEDTADGLHNAVVTAVQTGKIKPALASRLLRELSSEEDDPAIVEMKDGIFQDSITGAMIEIKNGVLRVVKLN
jgi:hypothetical protein